jgi:UDP-N-acetylmuramate dehydrogenase
MLKDSTLREKLRDIVSGKVLFNETMSRHTSIGVGGMADALVSPETVKELGQIITCLRHYKTPFIPVGNGTNLIMRDGGYRGVIISMKGLNNITLSKRNAGQASISTGAGAALSEIVRMATEESLAGMEFCAGIPGSVGGAVKMNAGAYGSEIKDTIEEIELLNNSGEIRELKRNALTFEYRNLDLPEGSVITGATFLLKEGIREQIQGRINEILGMRKNKHPLEFRNSGSIFKNPKGGVPAGQIIDELGLKGLQIGGAKISEKHGNFIINLGQAKAGDIIALIDMVKKKVKDERGITLETEVKIIGEDG